MQFVRLSITLALVLSLTGCATYNSRVTDRDEYRGEIYPAVKWSAAAFEDNKQDFNTRDKLDHDEAARVGVLLPLLAFPLWCCDFAVSACTDTLLLPFDLMAKAKATE
jgi:uncharacterized protein YceK